MPFPKPVMLSQDSRERLQALGRAGSTPQALAFRVALILRAGEPDQPTNLEIAAQLGCDRHTVGIWRQRFLQHGIAGLHDAPRSGRPRSFSPL